jgi:hypothetical protein
VTGDRCRVWCPTSWLEADTRSPMHVWKQCRSAVADTSTPKSSDSPSALLRGPSVHERVLPWSVADTNIPTHTDTQRHAHAQAQSTGKCQVAAPQPTRFFLRYIAHMQRQLTVDDRVQGPGSEALIFSVTSSNCLARFTLDFPILTQLSSSAVESM